MNKFFIIFLLLCSTTQADPFADGQPETGKKLFDKYKCNSCHNGKMGGDGNAIFTRPNRKVTDPQQLTAQINVCASNVGANFSTQEKLDLAAYLNKHFYKFK
ncbi:c-type cytochrome [Candidatus Nitrotoga arctica]|uniref:Cytochrome c domain-containing protein n=1 Tax=Candidatus Nitrotoga arctica TaxID=453162 RepID=A0ABN8APY0_9PROT|nr:cytochrome c [Candidatus Nitrotoga arctica]CAG9933742.1 Cytochrome c domain-containing protein [Candidatus Nitrotoga arctica]